MKTNKEDLVALFASRIAWYNKEIDKPLIDKLRQFGFIERSREIAQLSLELDILGQVLSDADKIYKSCNSRSLGFTIIGNEVIKLDE